MAYDPTWFSGSAAHYLRGRPPYSDQLLEILTDDLHLDGSGRLLDVGCGPGVLVVQLAPGFAAVIGLDPDAEMLDEARRHADRHGVSTVDWVRAGAEDIPSLDLGPVRAATFGQSFHWTDREAVAEAVYDVLEPGGSIVLIAHDIDARPAPPGPGHPPIPHDEVEDVIRRYLGSVRRAGRGTCTPNPDRYEDALARTRFGRPRILHAPGRTDLVRDEDEVISNYLSTSFAAPHLFGDRLGAFVHDVRSVLRASTSTGRFWDWPGDTVVLIATSRDDGRSRRD